MLLLLLLPLLSQAWPATTPRTCGGSIRHVRIAAGSAESATSMTVTFASIPSLLTSQHAAAPIGAVRYGKQPTHMNRLQLESDSTYYNLTTVHKRRSNYVLKNNPTDPTKEVYWYISPFYHHVTISNLEPDTVYYYQPLLRSEKEEYDELRMEYESSKGKDTNARRHLLQWPPYNAMQRGECPSPTTIYSFRTPPADMDTPITLALLGDLGQFPHSEETLEHLRMDISHTTVHAAFLIGDIAYTGGDHLAWDAFLDLLDDTRVFTKVPLHVTPGNHDIDKGNELQNRGIFQGLEHRFRMPRVRAAELGVYEGDDESLNMDQPPYPLPYNFGNAFYTVTYGLAKIICLNPYASMEPGSVQYDWLVHELKHRFDRKKTPWLLVFLHTPLYNPFSLHQHDPQIIAAQLHLEPILIQFGVNLVVTGHVHAYFRSHAVSAGLVNASGTVHVTVGAGGRKCEAPFRQEDAEEWVAVRDATVYGYGMLRILNRSVAEWQWIHTNVTDKERDYNEVGKSDVHLSRGPYSDTVIWTNPHV